MGHGTEQNKAVSSACFRWVLTCCVSTSASQILASQWHRTACSGQHRMSTVMKSYCIYTTRSWGKQAFKESRANFILWWQWERICLKGLCMLTPDIPRLKQFLGILLVVFINYLYSNITHKFRYLVQTYKLPLLASPSFPRFGADVRITSPSAMKQCQFTSSLAQQWHAEDVTQAVGNIPPPLSFTIQLMFSNDIPPCAHHNEMAGLPCVRGYYSLTYCTAIKGKNKSTFENTFKEIRQNWERAAVCSLCQNPGRSADPHNFLNS